MNWQELFDVHIINRGYNYYCDAAVEDLKVRNNTIMATVCGTDDYEVLINLDGDREKGKIKSMFCSCPYADSGANCKHMAAVLFEWENGDYEDSEEIGTEDPETGQKRDEVWMTIEQAEDSAVRSFLAEILRSDEKLFSRFRTLTHPEVSRADLQRYKKQVDATIRKYAGRGGFIDYHSAGSFIRELEEYLYYDVRTMLDNEEYLSAFELTGYIFTEVGSIEMDDSDGATEIFADACMEIWEEILENAEYNLKRTMFQWFMKCLEGAVADYMEDCVEQIFIEDFKEKEFLKEKLKYSDDRVQKAKRGAEDSWSAGYYGGKWALHHIELMKECKSPMEEILRYCRENWEFADVRKLFISECMKRKRYDEAVAALKESIQMDSKMPGLIRDHSRSLKEVYRISGRQEEYRQQLWNLVVRDDAGSLEYFKELKKLYSQQEWQKIREDLFEQLPSYAHVECLYEEEKLYDRLLAHVLQSRGLQELWRYEKVLVGEYPAQVLSKYADEVNQMARHTANRSRYQEWVGILRRMKKIEGGEKKVKEIVEFWEREYRGRTAMMEELKKL